MFRCHLVIYDLHTKYSVDNFLYICIDFSKGKGDKSNDFEQICVTF